MRWPLLCLCRPFSIFGRCLDSNPESWCATCLATHLPNFEKVAPKFFCSKMLKLDNIMSVGLYWKAVLLMDPDSDPDPAIFVIDLQDAIKKLIF